MQQTFPGESPALVRNVVDRNQTWLFEQVSDDERVSRGLEVYVSNGAGVSQFDAMGHVTGSGCEIFGTVTVTETTIQ